MSKYSDIKKRVVGQRGVADNKSGSGYSASGAYYDIKKKIKTQGTKYDIDDEYLDSFYSDAKSFFDDADSDYNNNSYSTAKANNENYKSRWSDLNRRAEYIRSYINSRKNSLDDETYSGMVSYLDQFNNASRQYLSAFRNASNYYSQWKTEDEYNDAVEAQKNREEMLSSDLDALNKDIDALKSVRDTAEEASKNRRNVTYNDLVSAYTRAGYGINAKAKAKADYEAIQANNSKVDSEIASILEGAGYSNIDELNDAITKKSTYYNQSKRLQDSAALYDKAKSASDFSHYASVGDALSNEKRDGFFVSEYDKKNKIGYLRNNPEAMDAFAKGVTTAGDDPLNSPVYKAAKYMTNGEYKVYSYYLGKEDTETAEKYVSYLDAELNQRAANAAYKIRKGNTLSELIFGVEAGLDQFTSGIKNLFNTNDEYIAPSYIQYASGMVREDLADAGFNIFGSSLGQIGYDIITTTSNMMPSILASSLVSMAFPGAQVVVAGKAIGAGQVVGAGLMGASAAGNAYQEMLNLGYDKNQARTYSTLTGLSEAGLQSVLGGIGSLGGVISGKSIESIAKGINKAAARFAIQFGGEMASEGLEEFLQDILDPLFKSYATKEFLDIPEGYLEQAVYSGMLGALSAGVLNSFDRATNRVMEYGAARQIKEEGKVNELVKVGKLFSADTVAYKLADKVTDNTGAWELSKLLHEVNANLSEQNQADIKYNLVRSGMREADADTVTEWLAKAVDGAKFTTLQQKALDENPVISRVFKKVIIDKNSTVNQRIQGMMNINGVEGQSGIDYAAIAKSQSKENLNKSANYYMAVKQAIAEKNKRDLGIGRTSALDAEMDRKASEFATEYAKSNNSIADNSAVNAVKQDVSEKVSDTNKTTVVSTGEEVSIKKIKSISNGNMELELTNGNTVNSKDIKYKSQDEALVYESVLSMGYSADTANAIVNGYNALTGVSASNYLLGVNEAYNYGRIGYPQESIKSEGFYADLTDAQKRFAYNLGREAAEADTKSAQNAIKKGSNNKTGKVHITSSISSMTQRQKASVSAIGRVVADATHNDVYIYESVEKDGKRVFSKDIAGHKAGEKAPNGFYDPNTGAIFIDINAGNGGEGVMLWTAAHELTHFIHQWSPAKFKVLADFLMEEYGKNGVDIQTLIQDQINKAKRSGRKLSFDGAYEEVVADAMQTMFTDTNLSEKIAKLKAKDQTLWQKIKSFFADLYKRITEAYKGLDPQTDEAKFVRSMKDSIEKLSDMFAEAIVDAGEAFSTADATLSENGIAVNPGTESASILSVRDVLDDSNRVKVAKALAWRFGVTEEEALNWITAETSLASLILNPKYSQYLDYVADPGEVAIKNNADYPQGTVDFSNICAKRREFTAVMNAILRNFPNHIFAATDLAKIRTIMQEEGMKVPCGICYVEDRRQLDTIVAQDFIKGLELYRKGSKTRPDGKPFNANQLKGLKLTDGDTYVPSVYELVTLEGRNKLKAKNPKMEEAWVKYNNARGMQAVRLLTNEAEYKRQILKYSKDTVKSKNDHGGLRIYSFSDAEMFHLIDIIQVITDSATVGLSLQGYTKVNEYAKAVKDTGEKLNRSLIPKGELGYHMENGKVVLDYDTVEGIDINSKDFFDNKDNPNVGNITIGINDIQIRAAMLSDFVDQIIPFHTGQSDDVLGEKGISTWNNYKDFQTEKDIATGKTSNHQINIYTEVIQALEREGTTINKRSFVEKFLQVCKDNNLTPRFSQFLNTDENGNYVYTEGYHKFLVDFKTFAQTETEYLPQMPVKPIFDNAYITRILKDYVKTQKSKDAEIAKSMPRVIERITNEIIKPTEKLSDRDSEYLELAKNPKKNEKRLRQMVDEAAKESGYTVEGWHGTGSNKFTKFGYGRNGIFITTDEDIANTYGSNVMHLYGTENNQIVIDADGHHFTDIPVPEWIRKEIDDYPLLKGKKDTDTLAKVAKNLGYSSIKIANVSDSFSIVSDTHKLSDVYCYFESLDELHFKNSQVKSADLVTYDDNGNIIPLSERFNSKNDDIRYSDRVLMGSLFSGGGTLEAGLVYQMLDKEFAVEYNRKIATVYTDNHGKEHMFVGDIRDFNSKEKQNVFYLHASPVCKSYSAANHSGGETSLDITTAQATTRVLEEQMPQVFTVENVKQYIGSDAYNIITKKLDELGYTWDVDVYKASDYGNATKRERMVIRAVKDVELPAKPEKVSQIISWGEATRDLWDTELIPSYLVKSKIEAIRNTPGLKNLNLTKLDKPLMIYDTNKSKRAIYAWADELAPTLTTKCGAARIIMPDGKVYAPTPKFMGRIQGLPDYYKYPKANTNAFKIIGNGIPTQLTKAVMGGVLDSAYEQTHNGQMLYSERVTDNDTLNFLNKQLENGDVTEVYRAMQVVEIDGKERLVPPMAGKVSVKQPNGKNKWVWQNPSEIGVWERSTEITDFEDALARGIITPTTYDDGRPGYLFKLKKGSKSSDGKSLTDIPAAYNPYIHTSLSTLNDQFLSAYKRPNLRIVKGYVPNSEVNGVDGKKYQAEYAKDSVGKTHWHSGVVAAQMPETREVILSRYFMPVEIMDDSDVAQKIKSQMKGRDIEIPFNVVSPNLRTELEKVGIRVGEAQGLANPPAKDSVKYSDRYDAKQRYVDRVMSKNADVETLSDDQHSALRKVAEMRHKFHSNPDGLFNTESAAYDMWNYVAQDGEINRLLEQAGLPTIEFGDYTYTPSTFDYEELGGKDEYETLEEWKEQSGVMDEFYKDFNDANERIEKYLRTIDEEHGTQYAPSGFSRLYSDRDPDATDNRTLLSNALESAAQNDNEKKLIERYKSKIDTINKAQKKLTDLRAKIKELSFAKGHRDVDQISKLQAEATNTANLISKLDKRLLKLEAAKPLKDVIDRERTLAKKKAEKAGKEALSEYREKAAQTQRELMNRYQERIKSGVENRRKHEFVNKIEKIAYDIQYRLEHPSAKTVIPEVFGKSVANFLKALDFTTFDNEGNVREGKANKTRAELRLSISNLADNLAKVSIEADYGQLDISADMLEWLKKMSTMLEEKYKAEETFYVRKMNSEELGDLYKLIKSLQTSINQASKFYTNMSSDVESLAYNTIIHLEPLYGKTHNTLLDSADKLLRWDYAQPITVFDRFGDSGRTLMRMLMQGQKTMADNVEAIDNFVQTAYTAEEVKKWREELHKITIQGKTYEVSTAFLMEFHNLLRDPDAKRHILEGGGIRFDDLVIGKKKTRFGDTYVTLEEAAAIDNVLTERQKQVAESLEKFLSEKGADWGNKISMTRFGYHAFGNIENYYPIKTIKAGSEYEARQKRANIYALLNKSFTKERNIHADNAIIVGDIFQTFNDHMSEMALYNAWALPVIDLIKWFNYRETQDVENKISEVSVKEALRQAYGKNADEYIRRLLESINSQKSGGLSESIAFKNLRMVNRVAVSANLRVAIQQPFSITRAMELISPKYVKPLVGDAKNNAYNEMVANSSFGKWKSMGYYDVDVSRPLEVKVLKNASFADKITEKSMFLAEAGDNFAWAVLWNACKAEVSEKNKGITNAELIAKTGERFDDIIIRTQVVDSVLTKSQWMRSDSFFHRMTSSFMSESMTSYNTLLRQYDRYSADAARTGKKSALKMNGKPIATTVTVFVLTQLINALVTAPLDAARDDDDYKTFLEKMLEKFKRSALQNLLPTSMMPYIADIVEYAMYGNTDRPDLQLYTKAIDLGKQLKRTIDNYDYFKLHKLINSALSMASSISGIPMSNIARDAIAVWNTVVGNIGNGELKFQTSPDSSSVAYEKMYEAIVNGNTNKAVKLYAQMQSNSVSADSINSALTSRVKQDYIDGKIDSDESSRLLKTIAEYTGKELTDDEIYWKIDKWNYEDENGTSDGYAKYDDFLSAVETGKDLRAVIQEYTENGVDNKTLASQITSHFKPIYLGMTRSERASIKGYLLNAYALLGYDRTKKSKDIDNWVK